MYRHTRTRSISLPYLSLRRDVVCGSPSIKSVNTLGGITLSLSLSFSPHLCTVLYILASNFKKKKKRSQGPGVSHQTCQVHIAAIKNRRQFMTLNLKLGCFSTISPKARGVGDGHFSYCCPRIQRVVQKRHQKYRSSAHCSWGTCRSDSRFPQLVV